MRNLIRSSLYIALFALILAACNMEQGPADDVEPMTQSTSSELDQLPPFNEDEMEINIDLVDTGQEAGIWTRDRSAPSGGVESVSAFGRDDVGKISIDSDNPSADAGQGFFWRTEGLRRIDNFGKAIHVDLYIDPAWEDRAVRAGFWVAGHTDGFTLEPFEEFTTDTRAAFAIIEFTTADSEVIGSSPDQAEISDGEDRWRIFDGQTGEWIDLDVSVNYGEWVTLEIVLDADNNVYENFIDGELQGTTPAGNSELIGEVLLNHYNYGYEILDSDAEAADFTLGSHDAHWHNGDVDPETRADCRGGGWEDFGFRNQGQCIRFVNTGQDSR